MTSLEVLCVKQDDDAHRNYNDPMTIIIAMNAVQIQKCLNDRSGS